MFWRRRTPKDFDTEIKAHLELETERFKQQGLSPAEASMAARRSFGNITQARERFYESGRWIGTDLLQDIRFGLRMLAKTPGSTAVAVITLALGIGANTAIFSLLDAVLLRNLPVQQPDRLLLFGKGEWAGSQDTVPDRSWQLFSYRFFRDFRQKNDAFSDVAAIDSILFGTHGRVARGTTPEKINVELVSGSYFHTLGVNAVRGRVLTDLDDQTPGGHPVAVASYTWWQRRLAEAPNPVGTTVTIGATVYSVIGVAPSGFFGISVGQAPDLWIPLAMQKQISPGWNGLNNNLFQSLYLIARRKPGVSVSQASANTNLLFRRLWRQYAGPLLLPKDLENIRHASIELTPAATGLSQLRQQFSSPLKILMVIVGLVLLIACANVANLLLARAVSRGREVAVRMSLGANRVRLIRQLLVESALLGLSGGIAGALFAWGVGRVLLGMVSPESSQTFLNVSPDAHVLGFTIGVAMLTVFLFGTVPALYATRLELAPALKEGRGVVTASAHNFFSRGLIIGQVSLSLVLLVGAGLFLHSLANLMSLDTGFDKRNVLIVGIDPGSAGYNVDARLENMMQQVEERVSSIPGVRNASFAFSVFGGGWTDPVTVPGRPKTANDRDVFHDIVGYRYLRAMKVPIILGRALSERDNITSRKVAVINETMARAYFSGASPIGQVFNLGDNPEWQNIQVIGVAKDAKYMSLKERNRPAAFYPHSQHRMFLFNLVARYSGDPKSLVQQIRRSVHAVDPDLPVSDIVTFEQVVNDSVLNQRLITELSSFFGLLAASLSCIGIYGVVSYGIARRTNEFGLRMALGAGRSNVLWMVIGETSRVLMTGVALGVALALVSARLIQSQLFGLTVYDPVAIGGALALMLAIALLAAYLPARGATRIDPMVALRCE
jgi:predicted permease